MKIVFTCIVGIHALIHVMGFMKGFSLVEIDAISKTVSKTQGIFWLFTAIVFIAGLILMYSNNHQFKWLLLLGIVFSQILIIVQWSDAKYGSLVNLFTAIVLLFNIAQANFVHKSERFARQMLVNYEPMSNDGILERRLADKPLIVQKWLKASLQNNDYINSVRLQQKGRMRTKPDGNWMPFTAEQYVNIPRSSFIWTADVKIFSEIQLSGRDRLREGEGEMVIKLLGIIPLVNERNNPKINSSALMRYLAEICWYPTAALDERIQWKSYGDRAAEATLVYNDVEVSGIFYFTSDGNFEAFESQRFYGGGDNSKLETWHIEALDYNSFHGVRIPTRLEVTWKFLEGDFKWLELEIVGIDYNIPALY